MGEHERHRAVADLPAEFLQHQSLEIGLVIDDEDGRGHAACPSLVSISWRSSAKSIGLVNKADRAALDRLAARFRIAIGGDHDHGNVGPLRAHLRQHLQPAHAGHVDVGQDQDQRRVPDLGGPDQRRRRRRRELHRKAPGFQVAPELLTKQGFDIGLVIHDEYVNAQFLPPAHDAIMSPAACSRQRNDEFGKYARLGIDVDLCRHVVSRRCRGSSTGQARCPRPPAWW